MSELAKWKEGDLVVIEPSRRNNSIRSRQIEEGIVTRVGRKYFYVDAAGLDHVFDISTGLEKPDRPGYTNYLDQARTPAEWAEEMQRRDLIAKIRALDVDPLKGFVIFKKSWSTTYLAELLDLLTRVSHREVT